MTPSIFDSRVHLAVVNKVLDNIQMTLNEINRYIERKTPREEICEACLGSGKMQRDSEVVVEFVGIHACHY